MELERYEAWNLALQINDVTLSNVVTRRELEDMKHGGVAPQINAVALSNVATRRFAESGNLVASSVLGFS